MPIQKFREFAPADRYLYDFRVATYCQNQNAQFNRVDWLACVYQDFLQELETRSMSSWTDEELKRYSVLTGQEEQEP